MAIARFESEPSQDLEELHAFLTANKEGTFLEDVTLSLGPNIGGTNNAKLSFGSDLFIQCLGVNHSSDALSFTGTYASLAFLNYTDNYNVAFRFASAILCANGLILSGYDVNDSKLISRIIITVDDEGELAVIVPSKSAYSFASSDTDYSLMTADSTMTTVINIAPSFSSNVTSLAPTAVKAMETTRMLPYAYAALTTQLNSEGLEAVLIDGVPFITNGIWYIRDSN